MPQRLFGSILVAIESPREPRQLALRRAAQLALTTGAGLTLLNISFNPYATGENFYRRTLQEGIDRTLAQRRAALERLAAPLRRKGLEVTVEASWDDPPHEGIVRAVLRSRPGLVVVQSRRHAPGARLFLTNTDWELIRLCPAPLLLVKHARPYGKARVLAAVDPLLSHAKPRRLDRRILDVAQALASAHAGRLDVVHAWLPPSRYVVDFYGGAIAFDPGIDQRYRRHVSNRLTQTVDALDLPPDRVHMSVGSASVVIPGTARQLRADVIVMGAVSRHGLKRLFIGSSAERVIDRAPCDVLVVKPLHFRTTVPRRCTPVYLAFPRA